MPAVTIRKPTESINKQVNSKPVNLIVRVRFIYGLILLLTTIFVVRLFYLQVIKYDYYRTVALSSQQKQYEIPAQRGTIYARDGDKITPIVLNEKKYTLFADPSYIKDALKESSEIAKIIGGDVNKLNGLLKTKNTRYVILAKKLSKEQSISIDKLNLIGIGTREES